MSDDRKRMQAFYRHYYGAFNIRGARAEIGLMKELVKRELYTEERATISDAYFGRVDSGEDSPLGLHIVVGCESGAVEIARYTEMEIIDEVMRDARATRMEELIGKTLTAYVTTTTGIQKGGYVAVIAFDKNGG